MTAIEDIGRRWVAACERAGVSPWTYGPWRDTVGRVWGLVTLHDGARWMVSAYGHLTLYAYPDTMGAIPDLTDDATRGAALGILRRAANDPNVYIRSDVGDGTWGVAWKAHARSRRTHADWPSTEAEAIVAAMEALPAKVTP